MFYTLSEQTEKKYSVKDAYKAAHFILTERGHTGVRFVEIEQTNLMTLVELNQMSDKLVREFTAANYVNRFK